MSSSSRLVLRSLGVLCSLAPLLGCEARVAVPERPAIVPPSAVWAGGADGGAWIDCRPISSTRFACTIFNDQSGATWARGEYLLSGRPSASEQSSLRYVSFDGVEIHLADEQSLIPDGWIEFPFSDGGGKRQRFEVGKPVSEEEEFSGLSG